MDWLFSANKIKSSEFCSTEPDQINYAAQNNSFFFTPRAGQKGICSQQWSSEDLPWTESGLVPDIVFNPHGFPSRMTIAMMIECMAGKSGAMHGLCYDATPFRYLCITY